MTEEKKHLSLKELVKYIPGAKIRTLPPMDPKIQIYLDEIARRPDGTKKKYPDSDEGRFGDYPYLLTT